jgi:AcrR family transcriptional regulator
METRKKLMRAALELFTQKGLDATTITDITEKADLGKGTFYRYFTDKNEVMAALLQDVVRMLLEKIREPASPRVSLDETLQHLLRCHISFFLSRGKEFLLLFQGRLLLKLDRGDNSNMEPPFVDYLGELEKQIAAYVPEGVRPEKVRRLAFALAGFASGFLSFAMVGMTPDDLERNLEPLRRAFVSGASLLLKG